MTLGAIITVSSGGTLDLTHSLGSGRIVSSWCGSSGLWRGKILARHHFSRKKKSPLIIASETTCAVLGGV